MGRRSLALVCLVVLLGACSGGAASTQPIAVVPPPNQVITAPSPTAKIPPIAVVPPPNQVITPPSPTPLPSLPPGFNACTLLTHAQASLVNTSNYGPGVNHLINGGFIECVWQTPTPPSSITLQVLSSSSDAPAQAAYAEAEASVHGFSLTPVTGVGDEAEIARAPGGVNTGGIYVRSGSIFFDVVYLNGTGASDAALQLAATEVMGNWP